MTRALAESGAGAAGVGASRPAVVLHARVCAGTGGGPDKTILRSFRYADPSRVSMHAVYLHPPGDPGADRLRQRAAEARCPLTQIEDRGAIDLAAIRRLLGLCRALGVNIWHAHDYKTDVLGLWLRRLHPMRLVTTVHGFTRETWRTRLYYHVDNAVLRRYDHVIAVSPPLAEHCRRRGVPADRLSTIPNAIELAGRAVRRRSADAKRDAGLPADRPALGVIGRLSVEKGVDRALDAFAAMRRAGDPASLHIVGDGPERPRLEAQARSLGIDEAVTWWGWRQDPAALLAAFDVLLLPSRTEGLPNVVLEAMALGVAVAATPVGGVPDLLDAGRCGLLLPEPEGSAWGPALSALLGDAPAREHLARLARRRVEQRFSFDQRMRRVFGVYDRVLGIKEAAARLAAA